MKYIAIFSAISGAVLVTIVAFFIHNFIVNGLEEKHRKQIHDQRETLNAQCDADKALTKEISNGLQQKNRALANQLNKLKHVQPHRCIVPTPPVPAGGHDAAAGDAGLSKPHGVTSDSLYDFAADAEGTGLQLDACQAFILKTWQSRGYKFND